MSKRQFKSQASSSRAISGAFPSRSQGFGFLGGSTAGHGLTSSTLSPLSYVTEPPDFSGISNSTLVVALKNLSKKDSTTKAKALEELEGYVLGRGPETGGVEDALLEAWIKLYPRTSIDSSRRVRQLVHTVQGHIAVSCGKRIARHMPKLVGAWLAGLYDNDRPVAKAARESFNRVFPTEEKMRAIWKVYHSPILEYSQEAILRETVQTLSDERTVSPDDAEAKYARVVGSSISVITHLLGRSLAETSTEETSKEHELYTSLFGDIKLWRFSSHHDAFVRRAVYKLLSAVVSKLPLALDYSVLSTTTVAEALTIDQTGSAYDYSDVLCVLTKTRPDVWTDLYTAKKPAAKGLRQFLKKGSQGAPAEYWANIERLFSYIPSSVITPNLVAGVDQLSFARDMLESLHDGVLKDSRINQLAAWKCYIAVAVSISTQLNKTEDRPQLFKEVIIPLFGQYITPKAELSRWSIGVPSALGIGLLAGAFHETLRLGGQRVLEEEWELQSETLIEHIKTSQPEQSKDYAKSQDAVAAEVKRWFTLTTEINKDPADTIQDFFGKTSVSLVECAIDVLKTRNGKPYGAAAAIEAAVRLVPSLLMRSASTKERITMLMEDDIPSLILSPSSPWLIAIICALEGQQGFETGRDAALQALIRAPNSSSKDAALCRAVRSSYFQSSSQNAELDDTILQSLRKAIKGEERSWDLIIAVLDSSSTSTELMERLLATVIESLSVDGEILQALHGLDLAVRHNAKAIKKFSTTAEGSKLLSTLLLLSESSTDDIAHQAATVSGALEKVLLSGLGPQNVNQAMIELISRELADAGPNSLSVESLIDQASKLYIQASDEDRSTVTAQIIPDFAQWSAAIEPLLKLVPSPALALTSPLGGAVYMVDRQSAETDLQHAANVSRDPNGYSPALRMAIYVVGLLGNFNIFQLLGAEQRTSTVSYILLILNLANDNLGLHRANHLWNLYDAEVEEEMSSFVSQAQALVAGWLKMASSSDSRSTVEAEALHAAQQRFFQESRGLSAVAYNHAQALNLLQSELSELYGTSSLIPLEESLWKDLRKSPDVFLVTAILTAYRPHKESVRLCNELVSDLTGFNILQHSAEGMAEAPTKHTQALTLLALRHLVVLNAIVQNQESIVEDIPQQRLVFLTKHLISSLGQETVSAPITAEILKLLKTMLPIIKGIYGSHWTEILQFIGILWSQSPPNDEEHLPVIHSSLRLDATLRSLVGNDEGNDDLDDAWQEALPHLSTGMVNLLKHSQAASYDSNQPLRVVHELLAREMTRIPLDHLKDPSELYPLLYENSRAVQETAYNLLHKHIPSAQEQISLDVALSKGHATLPDELLSLILEAPTSESLAEASFGRTMPLQLRGYLLSWKLVFDHFTDASYKVKADFVENIKQGTYLVGLLDLMSDFLGHSKNRPVDASKFDITSYAPDIESAPEKDAQWLLIHLYYLALRHLPTLSKNWWMACPNRQTVLAVETWTEKHITPSIIAAELATVKDWIPTQDADSQQLIIKVNPKAKEVIAGYEVDDQTMQIAIRLPPTYPLHQATVDGINRVGVDEKKWRSWLINTQGVITFSNGSLIDGLLAYRRNVVGALKGQSECAICYSIISADRQLPNKRCGTCKNTFHSLCLYKWFKSSNSSSCPLCRNAFNYS